MSIQTQEHELADSLRRTARRFATGVTIAAVSHASGTHALTANSFVTLSLRPALVGISVQREGRMRQLVEEVGVFGISVLNEAQGDCARRYADRHRDRGAPEFTPAAGGAPVVAGCVAHFSCGLDRIDPVGDHDLIIASVLDCAVADELRPPLIFLDGGFLKSVG
ncbi:flavin reductase family protein [Saccharopolyspora shandongensis]|uniref:flavin reductase family protein n=1 Tax=Saccharopolyspora shandongensis TaxID=418495 RepID=UPI003414AAEF